MICDRGSRYPEHYVDGHSSTRNSWRFYIQMWSDPGEPPRGSCGRNGKVPMHSQVRTTLTCPGRAFWTSRWIRSSDHHSSNHQSLRTPRDHLSLRCRYRCPVRRLTMSGSNNYDRRQPPSRPVQTSPAAALSLPQRRQPRQGIASCKNSLCQQRRLPLKPRTRNMQHQWPSNPPPCLQNDGAYPVRLPAKHRIKPRRQRQTAQQQV